MSAGSSDLKRILTSSGVYAASAVAQRALAFLLLPIYTRYLEPAEYGKLELLTVFTSITFGLLLIGLPSAIVKCYHRDCESPEQQRRMLATTAALAAPVLLLGSFALYLSAPAIGRLLLGTAGSGQLVRLAVVTGALTSAIALVLATLRAQERAVAFSVLTLTQFVVALVLNIVFVVGFGLGVIGVLWGNLISNALTVPLALFVASKSAELGFSPKLRRPLLHFGLLIIPVTLSGWVINMSDRYVLRLFTDLADVAVYGVGYKFGMLIELLIVWPFQLAWPAFSFSISHRPDHRDTYSKALTYLTALLAYAVVGLSLLTRMAIPVIVGEGYELAYRVVPWVALGYALNGIQYCVSPGVHIAKKTQYLTFISIVAAVVNLGLNLLLIPRWGMMAAAWSTAAAFFTVMLVTFLVSQRFYAVKYELGRLAKIFFLSLLVFALGVQVPTQDTLFSWLSTLFLAVLAFPLLLGVTGFLDDTERSQIGSQVRRCRSLFAAERRPPN